MAVHEHQPGNEVSQLSMGEMLAGVIVLAPLLGTALLVLKGVRRRAWVWLVDHQVVVPTHLAVINDGIGLDVYRILIAAGWIGLALTVGYGFLRRRLGQRIRPDARR